MQANVEITDRRLKRLTELLDASKDKNKVVISTDDLKMYHESISRLAFMERHIHNLNAPAYKTLTVVE